MIKFSIQTKIKYTDNKDRERVCLDVDLNTGGKLFEIVDLVPKKIDVKIADMYQRENSTESPQK